MMMAVVVKELVGHILGHVNAEAAARDPSQIGDVAQRAQYIRDTVSGLETDGRRLTIDTIMGLVSDAASLSSSAPSLKQAIVNMRGDTRPQLGIQAWVGKASEHRG